MARSTPRWEPPAETHGDRGVSASAAAQLSHNEKESGMSSAAAAIDMGLEAVVIPVSDVDRAKAFYEGLGWRLDADFAPSDDFRIVQFTPPGSGCSIQFGTNVAFVGARFGRGALPDRLRHRRRA